MYLGKKRVCNDGDALPPDPHKNFSWKTSDLLLLNYLRQQPPLPQSQSRITLQSFYFLFRIFQVYFIHFHPVFGSCSSVSQTSKQTMNGNVICLMARWRLRANNLCWLWLMSQLELEANQLIRRYCRCPILEKETPLGSIALHDVGVGVAVGGRREVK